MLKCQQMLAFNIFSIKKSCSAELNMKLFITPGPDPLAKDSGKAECSSMLFSLFFIPYRHMALTEENVDKYVRKTAHELAKKKCKNTRLPENDDSVETIRCDLEKLLIETDLKVAATVSIKFAELGMRNQN